MRHTREAAGPGVPASRPGSSARDGTGEATTIPALERGTPRRLVPTGASKPPALRAEDASVQRALTHPPPPAGPPTPVVGR